MKKYPHAMYLAAGFASGAIITLISYFVTPFGGLVGEVASAIGNAVPVPAVLSEFMALILFTFPLFLLTLYLAPAGEDRSKKDSNTFLLFIYFLLGLIALYAIAWIALWLFASIITSRISPAF